MGDKYNKVLYSTKWIDLMEMRDVDNGVQGYVYTHSKWTNGKAIAILPYRELRENEYEYLLRHEVTPCWGLDPVVSSITGGMDKFGESPIECAVRELEEEAGYRVESYYTRWHALGKIRMGKSSTTVMTLFGVDLTGLEQGEAPGDGTELEALASCEWHKNLDEAGDAVTLALGFRLTEFLRSRK